MDFKKLLKQKMDAQAGIVNAAIAANRGMTAEEKAQYDALEIEIVNLEATIEAQAQIEAREAALATPVNQPTPAIEVKEKKWNQFGDFLQAVRAAGTPGGIIDNRLLYGVKASASGGSEAVNSDGGFLIDEQYVAELLTKVHDTSAIASRCRSIPIGPNANRIRMNGVDETSRANGSRWGGVQAYWTSEAETVASSKPKFKKIELNLDKLMALCYLTDELMEDAVALEAIIRQAFAEELAFKLDDAVLNGAGTGIPQGILKSDALVTVAAETSQDADTINHWNILKMYNRMYSRSRGNAVWFINQETEPQLETMTITVGTGGEVSPYAKEYMERGTIKGRPVIPVEQCSALGTVGDIILADMSQYMIIDKGGVNAQSSVHVRFLYDENVMRFTYRVNGMPLWDTAVTPYKGSSTYSPFVALATRA
ncbi:MAG: phage capsid family protein [Firmicutes bacterium]|nr:phage capsid family protein [Bacillota bacterium]